MNGQQKSTTVGLEERIALIRSFPCFSNLSGSQCSAMAALMHEVDAAPQDNIVSEEALVDAIYIIVSGQAEVTHAVLHHKRTVSVPVAVLGAGEGIGLNDMGFYSTTGKRTATVTALTPMRLLKLEMNDLYLFLKQEQLESSMANASMQMLCMRFIKQSLPFANISHERLQWLADHVEEMSVPAGTIIFKQGEKGDCCYLIRSGHVEIIAEDEKGEKQVLALLKPPVLFGEATLITHSPRNATAKAQEDCDLLVLRHEHLSELIESEDRVASMFMTLMVDRSRPIRNPAVSIHQRTTADGQIITILKNPDTHRYFKLAEEGLFIWNQLDGQHTLHDMTLKLAEEHNLFAPDVVVALISKLTRAGFIYNVEITDQSLSKQSWWMRSLIKCQRLLNKRVTVGDADAWVSHVYEKYLHVLFTRKGQWVLSVLAMVGFISFIASTNTIMHFFATSHASMLLLLTLIPLSVVELLLHEFGHAFTVKAFGREVHYMGVGWMLTGPVAFTDTSDMWLADRKPRMLVNLAGVFVDVVAAGLAAIFIPLITNPYVQGVLWLFALYTYIGAFRMLSPLQEMDGYYVLMDWVEKNHLRQSAVLWLVKKFPACLRHPRLFSVYKAEVVYWVACFIYLVLITLLTLLVQTFIFKVLGIQAVNIYISLILPFLVVLVSSLGVVVEIKNSA